jgi:methionyl-tRNA formyltransferase
VRRCGLAYAAYVACSATLSDRALAHASVAGRARREAIPLLETDRVNAPESLAFLAQSKPDLLVSAFFNQRIGPGALAAAPLGGLNVHPGALPRFRGVDPVFRAWLEEAPTLEASVHRVTAEFDAGALLGKVEVTPVDGESVLRATARAYAAGAALLDGLADAISARDPGQAQDETAARYDSWPTREEVGRLRGRGVALARWSDLYQASRIVESARTPPP